MLRFGKPFLRCCTNNSNNNVKYIQINAMTNYISTLISKYDRNNSGKPITVTIPVKVAIRDMDLADAEVMSFGIIDSETLFVDLC